MRSLRLVALYAVFVGACSAGALEGSGRLVERDEVLEGFDGIDVTLGTRVTVTHADEYAVRVSADDNAIDRVRVDVVDGTLRVRLAPGSYREVTVAVDVSMPLLAEVVASLGSRVVVTGFGSDTSFRAVLTGGSELTGTLGVGAASFEASGGSKIDLAGSAATVTVIASAGSEILLRDLLGGDVQITASTGSVVEVTPSGRLDATATGGATVRHWGDPELGTLTVTDSSEIVPG